MKIYTDLHRSKTPYKNTDVAYQKRRAVTVVELDSGYKLTKCIYSDLWFIGLAAKDLHLTGRLITTEEALELLPESDKEDFIFNLHAIMKASLCK
jgi:hypothetical protein